MLSRVQGYIVGAADTITLLTTGKFEPTVLG